MPFIAKLTTLGLMVCFIVSCSTTSTTDSGAKKPSAFRPDMPEREGDQVLVVVATDSLSSEYPVNLVVVKEILNVETGSTELVNVQGFYTPLYVLHTGTGYFVVEGKGVYYLTAHGVPGDSLRLEVEQIDPIRIDGTKDSLVVLPQVFQCGTKQSGPMILKTSSGQRITTYSKHGVLKDILPLSADETNLLYGKISQYDYFDNWVTD